MMTEIFKDLMLDKPGELAFCRLQLHAPQTDIEFIQHCRQFPALRHCVWISDHGSMVSNLPVWENLSLISGMQEFFKPAYLEQHLLDLLLTLGWSAPDATHWLSQSISSLTLPERLYATLVRTHLQPFHLLFVELAAWELLTSSLLLTALWSDLRARCRVMVLCPASSLLPPDLSLAKEVHLELCRG